MTTDDHNKGMTLLALAWARQDARKARRGSAEQHDAANRGGRLVYSLRTVYGMTEADIDVAMAAMEKG